MIYQNLDRRDRRARLFMFKQWTWSVTSASVLTFISHIDDKTPRRKLLIRLPWLGCAWFNWCCSFNRILPNLIHVVIVVRWSWMISIFGSKNMLCHGPVKFVNEMDFLLSYLEARKEQLRMARMSEHQRRQMTIPEKDIGQF